MKRVVPCVSGVVSGNQQWSMRTLNLKLYVGGFKIFNIKSDLRIEIPLGCKITHMKSGICRLFIRASLNAVIYGHDVCTLKICLCPRAGTVTSDVLV